MALLPAKGQLKMSDIREHYEDLRNKDETQIALQDYYRGGTYVAVWGSNGNVPTKDDIAVLDFRGQGNKLVVTYDIIGGGGGGGAGSHNADNKGKKNGDSGRSSKLEVWKYAAPGGNRSNIKRITAAGGRGGRGSDESTGSSSSEFKPTSGSGEPAGKGESGPLGGAGGKKGDENKSGDHPANNNNSTGAGGGGGGHNKDTNKKGGVYNRDAAGQGGQAGERKSGSFTIDPCPKYGYIKIIIGGAGAGANDTAGGTSGGRGNGGYVSVKIGSNAAVKLHRRPNTASLEKVYNLGDTSGTSPLW
jgi:hypothetical protein